VDVKATRDDGLACQLSRDAVRRGGLPEKETLGEVTTHLLEQVKLVCGLHALGCRARPKAVSQRYDGLEQRPGTRGTIYRCTKLRSIFRLSIGNCCT